MDERVQQYLQKYSVLPQTIEFLQQKHRIFIDGQWLDACDGRTSVTLEPYTQGILASIAQGGAEDVERAVTAARRALDHSTWRTMKPLAREQLLFRFADLIEHNAQQLAEIEAIDMGKSVTFAKDVDVQGTIDTLRYFAGWASKIHGRTTAPAALPGEYFAYTCKEPVGVVGMIVPWNFPLQTLMWKLAAALCTGCTTVIKPAELTSLSALRLAELAQEAGIPKGVINIVTGRGSVVGAALAVHPNIDKISFTGSTEVGRAVGRSAMNHLKRLTLELGGKSPVIVTASADIASAAQAVANGVFFNSGQVCDAGTRVYIEESIHDAFLQALVDVTRGLKIAPGLDPACYIGPMVSTEHKRRVVEYIQTGRDQGAQLCLGGDEQAGNFVAPTIFTHVRNDMRIVREEIFGPVLVTSAYSTLEDAVRLANDSVFGLAAAIYSQDLNLVHKLIPRLQAGTVYVNAHSTLDPALPFGGMRQSGFGKDMGAEQLDELLHTKAVWITL